MAETQDILYGVGSQVLFFDCPEGRPDSVTSVSVHENINGDNSTAEVATTGSATVETNPNTSLSGAAGASQLNPRLIALTTATGVIRGRRYLVTDTTLEREWVEVELIDTSMGADVYVKHPLHNDYVTGAGFASVRISISVLDSWAATEGNISGSLHATGRYRVRWVYVAGGVTYVADSYFDLVRYPGSTDITPLDVAMHVPGWLDSLPDDSRTSRGADLIEAAYRQVKYRLIADGKADQLIRDSEVMGYVVALKADEIKAYGAYRTGGDLERYETARDRWFEAYSGVLGSSPALLESRGDTGAATVAEPVRITVR